jgi:peptide-methionine (R)-S-oxide reductase
MADANSTTDDDFKKKLTPEQFHVLREKGTEPPFSGKLLYNHDDGVYACAACGTPLFSSAAKYDSTDPGLSGWPSFDDAVSNDKITVIDDMSWGMHRKEVICNTCGSHLGHLFPDDSSPTGQHYCINSAALNFTPKK